MLPPASLKDLDGLLRALETERRMSVDQLRSTHASMRMVAAAFNHAMASIHPGAAELRCVFAEPAFDPAGGPTSSIAAIPDPERRFELLAASVRVVPCNRICGELSTFEALLPALSRGIEQAPPMLDVANPANPAIGSWVGVLHETVASGAADASLASRSHRRMWRNVLVALENRRDSLTDSALADVVAALCGRIKTNAEL